MTMRLPALGLLAAVALAGAPVAGTPLSGTVERRVDAGADRVDAALPGRVQSVVVHRDSRGKAIWLLVAAPPADRPAAVPGRPPEPCEDASRPEPRDSSLWRFDPLEPSLERVAEGLLAGATLHVADTDGDGAGELVALQAGELVLLDTSGGPARTLLADDAIDPRASSLLAGAAGPLLALPDLHAVRFLSPAGGAWSAVASSALPMRATFARDEFRITTATPRPIETRRPQGLFVTPPEALGNTRLRGLLLRPGSPDVEWWAALPEPETVVEHAFLEVGGAPALLVATRSATRLNLLGEKALRLYRLEADRSRTGHAPIFAVRSRANLWQPIVPAILDVSGDGHEDLVLAYWTGLRDARIELETHLGDGAGSFEDKPRVTGFDVRRGERSWVGWGHDVSGDGLPDLLVIGAGRLEVHPGKPSGDGRNLAESGVAWAVSVVDDARGDEQVEMQVDFDREGLQVEGERLSSRGLRFVDIDDDGIDEVLFAVPAGEGYRLSHVRFGD